MLVYPKEPPGPMKQWLKEEGEGGEELAHKRVMMDLAETMKIKLQDLIQVLKCLFCDWLGIPSVRSL